MLLRSRSFLIPTGLSIASFVVALVTVGTPNTITVLLVTLFLGPLPIGSIYAAGALAPKASWLMGGIASLIGTAGLIAYALIGSSVVAGTAAPQLTDIALCPQLLHRVRRGHRRRARVLSATPSGDEPDAGSTGNEGQAQAGNEGGRAGPLRPTAAIPPPASEGGSS